MEKAISSEVKFDLDIKDGKIVVSAMYDGKGLDSTISLAMDGEYFLDKLAEKIPGKMDDMIIAAIKGALK